MEKRLDILQELLEEINVPLLLWWAFVVAQTVENLPARQQIWVLSLVWEDLFQKGMAIHFSICLENSMDRGAWWAIVHGITKRWALLSD